MKVLLLFVIIFLTVSQAAVMSKKDSLSQKHETAVEDNDSMRNRLNKLLEHMTTKPVADRNAVVNYIEKNWGNHAALNAKLEKFAREMQKEEATLKTTSHDEDEEGDAVEVSLFGNGDCKFNSFLFFLCICLAISFSLSLSSFFFVYALQYVWFGACGCLKRRSRNICSNKFVFLLSLFTSNVYIS